MNGGRLLAALCGVAVGLVFIYAGWGKIFNPKEFSDLIGAYQFFPRWTLNGIAILLPWIEVVCGALMVIGLARRSAALVIAGLSVGFLFMLGWAMHHGLDINCGCFPSETEHKVGWADIGRDLLLLGGCMVCLFAPTNKRS